MKKTFKRLVVAGTFDHFHKGHKKLVENACTTSQFVFCGLTKDSFVQKKPWAFSIQPFKKRFSGIEKAFYKKGFAKKHRVLPIKDIYGFTLTNPYLEAIMATKESLPGVLKVNKKRTRSGLKKLSPIMVDLIRAQDKKRISSTRIRKGEINRQGLVYSKLLPKNKTLHLPDNQRIYFKKPIGELISGSVTNSFWAALKIKKILKKLPPGLIVTVGDIATQSFILSKIAVNLAVVDFKHRRKNLGKNFHQNTLDCLFDNKTVNFPGTISFQLSQKLKQTLPKLTPFSPMKVINISGEEDLAVLPIMLLSPLNTFIFYGQPEQGIVQVRVTEKTKQKAVELLGKFL